MTFDCHLGREPVVVERRYCIRISILFLLRIYPVHGGACNIDIGVEVAIGICGEEAYGFIRYGAAFLRQANEGIRNGLTVSFRTHPETPARH